MVLVVGPGRVRAKTQSRNEHVRSRKTNAVTESVLSDQLLRHETFDAPPRRKERETEDLCKSAEQVKEEGERETGKAPHSSARTKEKVRKREKARTCYVRGEKRRNKRQRERGRYVRWRKCS
ncbi:hypothetical protein WMY93_025838 [Mugilogobius chulae]|uniref:Uncharacterized protein n=1 Tax=Mugilogobius chulae TaxID=88201 RepID=A0AAW0MVT3_9GOBI